MEVRDLSVLITARNEEFLSRTVDGILDKKRGNTEIIIVCDGNWPSPVVQDHPDVTLIYHSVSIGQRAAINEAARLSRAKFIMKIDAHCIVDEGFDVKLMADCEENWTVIPRMYNLHGFDFVCTKCGNRLYQRPTVKVCENCGGEMKREIIWKPRLNRLSDFFRFDQDLHFQYWNDFKKRPAGQGDICDTMSNLGACWFMHRKRYWEMDGLDEGHGSWGQMGTEIACKTWLSGGRQVVNKKTWFSHLFRTQGGDFGFPYPVVPGSHDKTRKYSQDLWRNNKWPKAIHDLKWLVDKFSPVPGWPAKPTNKGIIYYTDNQLELRIAHAVQARLKSMGLPIVSASLKPMGFGKNVVVKGKRGHLTMFKQILAALEASNAEIVFFCEHDVLYHQSHFDFVPPRKDIYYYNENTWKLRESDGHCLYYECRQLSGLCAYRELLIEHYRKRIKMLEDQIEVLRLREVAGEDHMKLDRELDYFRRCMGFEPGTHTRKERVDNKGSVAWRSEYPNVDIRHGKNFSFTRWKKEEFANERNTVGWTESDEIPGWGKGIDILKG